MTEQKGYLKGVFHREEVGDIDLVWGNNKVGLKHIIRNHVILHDVFDSVEDAFKTITDVLQNGIHNIQRDGRHAYIKDGYRVAIEQSDNGNWVLTALDVSRKKKSKRRSEQDTARLDQSIFGEENGTLVSPQA